MKTADDNLKYYVVVRGETFRTLEKAAHLGYDISSYKDQVEPYAKLSDEKTLDVVYSGSPEQKQMQKQKSDNIFSAAKNIFK